VEAIVRVKQKGQVTMPNGVRELLSLREGDLLRVTMEGRRIVLEPIVQGRAVAVPFDVRRLDGLVGVASLGGDAVKDAEQDDE